MTLKLRVTAKQKSARRRNMAVARKSRKKKSGTSGLSDDAKLALKEARKSGKKSRKISFSSANIRR